MTATKFLLVFHQRSNSIKQINDTIILAKNLTFIDFVVLKVILNKTPVLYRYNFTSRLVETQKNISKDLKLFPDKIKNMNGYNLRVGVEQDWNSLKKNLPGYPAHLAPHSRLDQLYAYFTKFVNVTTKTVKAEPKMSRLGFVKKYNLDIVLGPTDIIMGKKLKHQKIFFTRF